MPMAQQSPIDEQIREYLLQQERIDEARRQQAPISPNKFAELLSFSETGKAMSDRDQYRH
jgi:hypothetical protein